MGRAQSTLRADDLSDNEDIFVNNPVIKISQKSATDDFRDGIIGTMGDNIYVMSDGCRGRCLIINNKNFQNSDQRNGSEIDVTNLDKVFRGLGFDVIIKQDLKSNDFTKVMSEELSHPDHGRWGMFVLIVMSHGSTGNVILGTDGVGVDQHEIFKSIYNCEMLKGKPKFIVVQACAGEDSLATSDVHDWIAVDPVHPSASNIQWRKCAPPDDVLVLKSAFYGFVSIRDKELGSPFIRALVEALYKHAHNHHLKTICKQVKRKMKIFNKTSPQKAPTPVYYSNLYKKLYLLPCAHHDQYSEEEPFGDPKKYSTRIWGTRFDGDSIVYEHNVLRLSSCSTE